MNILSFLPTIMQMLALGPKLQGAITSGGSAVDILEQEAPELLPVLEGIGKQLFPSLSSSIDKVGGVVSGAIAGASGQVSSQALQAAITTVFDTAGVTWVQNALNKLGQAPKLDADGLLGPLTMSAVRAYQGSHGLRVDGWPGPLTAVSLATDLARLLPAK